VRGVEPGRANTGRSSAPTQDGTMDGEFKMLSPEELITLDPDQLRQLVQERREEERAGAGAAGGRFAQAGAEKRRERLGRGGGKEHKVCLNGDTLLQEGRTGTRVRELAVCTPPPASQNTVTECPTKCALVHAQYQSKNPL